MRGEGEQAGHFYRVVFSVSVGFEKGGSLNGNEQVICGRCRGLIPI